MTLGDSVILALAALILFGIATQQSLSRTVRHLLVVGLALRIAGGQLYLYIGEVVYGGTADYWFYFYHGRWYADALLAGTPEESGSYWLELGAWWGTAFTIRASGLLSAAINPSIYGAFVAFSLIGFLGVVAFAVAFCRAFPAVSHHRYLLWLMFFPSLWYWPAALGKDALMMAGIGVAVLGFVGRKRNRPNWLVLLSGTALTFAVRPQVAVMLLFAFGAGHWLFLMRRATASRVEQGLLIAALGLGVLLLAKSTLNLTFTNVGEVGDYLAGTKSAASRLGGSSIATGSEDRLNPLAGAAGVLMRPFLWEARGATALVAALEILGVWTLAWLQRRRISNFIRLNYGDRVFWMAAVFIVAYVIGLGMAAGNLGVIARQRVHVFPMLFMFFAGPSHVWSSRRIH